jgi:hypothetical protein
LMLSATPAQHKRLDSPLLLGRRPENPSLGPSFPIMMAF